MRLLLTGIIFAGGLVFLFVGVGFLVDPTSSGADFGLGANGPKGLSTLRADMPAFFFVVAGSMIIGAWRRNGDLLLVATALVAIAFVGRTISLFADGLYEGFVLPMTIEAASLIILLIASRVLPHRVG